MAPEPDENSFTAGSLTGRDAEPTGPDTACARPKSYTRQTDHMEAPAGEGLSGFFALVRNLIDDPQHVVLVFPEFRHVFDGRSVVVFFIVIDNI